MTIDWQATALAARRANAAYIEKAADSKAAFSLLGDTWIAMRQDASHQAVISVDATGAPHLSISGTRASNRPLDVFADVSLSPVAVSGGNVTAGVFDGMAALWDWAKSVAPSGAAWNVSGHSLGAARTHLTPLFVPPAQLGALHSFESPKFADAAYYAAHAAALARMVCVLDGADLWAAWPWHATRWSARPLADHIWLKDDAGGYAIIPGSHWPGGINPADHDMDRVQSRLEVIARQCAKNAPTPACAAVTG